MNRAGEEFAMRVFRTSILKQAKLREIVALLGDTTGMTCLDIGGDNGVISLLLRQRGGTWYSADLDAKTVESIRALVGDRVARIDGQGTPFSRATFDRVVIVDFLEHTHTDREFVIDVLRILKPGGELIINVPHCKQPSLLHHLRDSLGLTDEWHGHVRPGYTRATLARTLAPHFVIREVKTYSRAFSECVDIALTLTAEFLKRGQDEARSSKGSVVTAADVELHRGKFRLLGFAYPFLWLFSRLDVLLFWQDGYKLIARTEVSPAAAEPGGGR